MTESQLIDVQYPVLDHTESIANIMIATTKVDTSKLLTIKDAFHNRNNSLIITILNKGDDKSILTMKAGDAYPNSMLGDIDIEIGVGISAIHIQDLARFEKADGSIDLEFKLDFDGEIYAIAKYAGVK